MKPSKHMIFSPFRLDVANRRLFRGERLIPLRPKALAVLQHLAERPHRLVTKDELLDAVWPGTAVSDTVLKVCVREIRAALEDDQRAPRFIETAHRAGYRFIAPVAGDNLPVPLTELVGREREVAEIRRLLAEVRLLTLTGAGGSGKTRLALEAAGAATTEVEDGVWWVDLAALADPALVPQAVASALEVREHPGRALTETLIALLQTRRSLLVLDNCEHLISACAALVTALLRGCPRLRILATSREALGVEGETAWPVPPLSLPDEGPQPLAELLGAESARLFVARAAAAWPPFAPDGEGAAAVARICRHLDGMPLAIELAAARVRVLPVEQILVRLRDGMRLLSASNRSASPRHQTLQATIDWSYGLLTAPERTLLQRLAVFAGGFTLEAAEAVCAGGEIAVGDVFELIARLVDKSLVGVSSGGSGGGVRYRLLETIRQYGREKLTASGEEAASLARHVTFFRALAEEGEPQLRSAARGGWLARLEGEHGNLRAALGYADAPSALRLAGDLFWFWLHAGYWSEGRGWLARALALPGAAERTRARARALSADGVLAWAMGDHGSARARLEESTGLWRALGDELGLAHTLHFLAVELLDHGEAAQARAAAEESVAIFRRSPDDFGRAVALVGLGVVALAQADYAEAESVLVQSVALCRAARDRWALALPLRNLGIVALRRGDYERAVALLKETLVVLRDGRERWFISRSLETLAEATALRGEAARAARLFGASEALREALGAAVLSFYRADYDRGVAAAQAGLGAEAFAEAWAAGRALTMEEAIAYALAGKGERNADEAEVQDRRGSDRRALTIED